MIASPNVLNPDVVLIGDDCIAIKSSSTRDQSSLITVDIIETCLTFVNPLNVQNVEGSPYLKDSNAVLVTTIHRQRKENPVLKNDKMKREKRSQSRPLSKKLNNSQEKSIQDSQPAETDLSMLTLNELLQTMPGNKMKNFIKKVTKKITCDQSDQDLGKELPALDVKKLNMIVKSYTDSEQEASLKCLGEQTTSLPNQILHAEPSHPQSYERSLSNLSFSRAFTFSVFDLPDGYREKNKQLQRRAYTAIKSH
ncbi:unnamed protein product [Mytilus coruscus]|uniref:Uncharacterized protein n=1 Tax=Mytilus coruscus TaxID=42192 RepID=A0A6J8D2L8_MYTCO|nr:unnamed protein product [Mytilus coruscus]